MFTSRKFFSLIDWTSVSYTWFLRRSLLQNAVKIDLGLRLEDVSDNNQQIPVFAIDAYWLWIRDASG